MSPLMLAATITGMIAFGIGGGVLFGAMLVGKQRSNQLLALLGAALMIWSVIFLIESAQGLREFDPSSIHWQLVMTAFLLTMFGYTIYVSQYFTTENTFTRRLLTLMPILFIAATAATWADGLYTPVFELRPNAWFALLIAGFYSVYATWKILTADDKRAKALRIPALLMVLCVGVQVLDAARTAPLSVGFAASAVLVLGWSMLRDQIANPLSELTDELRVANRDLRQVVTDLATERGRTADLTRRLELSQSYAAYKNDFLNALGHRLRTPLNSIVGYSELLESGMYGELSEKQQDRLSKIHRNGDTLLAVINDMLDLNRIDSAQMTLQLHQVSVRDVIDQAVMKVETERASKGLAFEFEIAADAGLVRADESRLIQVMTPLLDHAVQAQAHGAIRVKSERIRVKSGLAEQFALPLIGWLADGEWIVLQVHDHSDGLTPEVQAQLFDAFAQAIDTQNQEMHGTGLGLIVAKKLVELHQGVLWVKSQPRQGTTFFVALRALDS
jgi:signal transduction histidine kinase